MIDWLAFAYKSCARFLQVTAAAPYGSGVGVSIANYDSASQITAHSFYGFDQVSGVRLRGAPALPICHTEGQPLKAWPVGLSFLVLAGLVALVTMTHGSR
jgi:hypothetical protein